MALSQAIRDRWAGEAVPQESPAYDPQSNGAAEAGKTIMGDGQGLGGHHRDECED